MAGEDEEGVEKVRDKATTVKILFSQKDDDVGGDGRGDMWYAAWPKRGR